MAELDYVDIANQYSQDVVSGEIDASQLTIAMCQRQIDDLSKDWGYTFDRLKAARICKFVELQYHIKGEWARRKERIKLEPWMIFILTTVFGWVNEEGYRRFRTVYIEVPRKNAKSTLSSAVGLYMLVADGEAGAEVYSTGTTRDQARIVFRDAQAMCRKNPAMTQHYGVHVGAHNIHVLETASKFESLSADGSTLDGLNIHCNINDEVHAQKTRHVYDVCETATGSRKQSLMWNITTAGSNRTGICYELRTYLVKILNRVAEDETFFGAVYTIDEDDDWTDPAIWKKANPNYGVSVYPEDIARLCRKAQEMASAQNNFLTKRLNVWVNADTAWMSPLLWDKCGNPELFMEDFSGEKCWIGLDLASKKDIAAMVCVFKRDNKYYVFGKYYLPEETVENSNNSQYAGWALSGRLITTPGPVTDYRYIQEELRSLRALYDVQEVAYDPWQATEFSTRMLDEGLPMVEVSPYVRNFSEPMKNMEALILERNIIHDECPVLSWMISNVVAHRDHKDNIFPRREHEDSKIDGVVAAIMALSRAMLNAGPARSRYEDPDSEVMVA